jgi:hypothetical protein
MQFQESYVMKIKISNLKKKLFLSITFPCINNLTWNIDEINVFLVFGLSMAFDGLCWPLLALDDFFKTSLWR